MTFLVFGEFLFSFSFLLSYFITNGTRGLEFRADSSDLWCRSPGSPRLGLGAVGGESTPDLAEGKQQPSDSTPDLARTPPALKSSGLKKKNSMRSFL